MKDSHPIYKIIAVLCVGSVAKALFASPRPTYNVTQNLASAAADAVAAGVDKAVTKA